MIRSAFECLAGGVYCDIFLLLRGKERMRNSELCLHHKQANVIGQINVHYYYYLNRRTAIVVSFCITHRRTAMVNSFLLF